MKTKLVFMLVVFSVLSTYAQNNITYISDNSDFVNPERGFYRFTQTFSSNYSLLNQSELVNYRVIDQTPYRAKYTVKSSLIQRILVLDNFRSTQLSTTFLNNLQTDFNTIRSSGLKVILRFFYPNPNVDCISPFGDAPSNIVLKHIAQLKPLFHTNKDIIASVQMGFIGCWGEQYYANEATFGNLDGGDYNVPLDKWQLRNQVLDSLLSVVPQERMVQVRFPHFKQKLTNGLNAPSNTPSMSISDAYNRSKKSRVGFHNDCFLAAYADAGTYNYYPIGLSGIADTTNLKPYTAIDATYTAVGGETCAANGTVSLCLAQGGIVESELKRFKYSFLNADYNVDVLNTWSCFNEVKNRLGYRFVLQNGTFTAQVRANQTITIQFSIRNEGYAAPYNPRMVEVVLRHTSGAEWKAPLSIDPRYWFSGQTININQSLCLPNNIPTGTYRLFLNLPDPEPTLYANPAYSIRLANLNPTNSQSIWETATGYNDLLTNIAVSTSAPLTMNCTTQFLFASNVTQPCPPSRLITDEFYSGTTKIYKAANQIESKAIINSGTNITFQSGKSIIETPSHFVKNGAVYKNRIGACNQ